MTNRILCLLTGMLFVLGSLSAQNHDEFLKCGTEGQSKWLKQYQAGEIPRGQKSANVQYIPINLIIVGRDDGTGYVAPAKVLGAIELLNESFENMNIQFFIDGDINFLNSSAYYQPDPGLGRAEQRQMRQENDIRNKANLYYVGDADGACGYAELGGNSLVMSNTGGGCADIDLVHEFGHLFTLPHTFLGWESVGGISEIDLNDRAPSSLEYRGQTVLVEKADGSNCEDAADGFCDTPADYLMERWNCNNTGEYRDSLTDPDSLKFAVPGINFMSYSLGNCSSTFSEEQRGAMLANIGARLNLAESGPANPMNASADDLELLFPENNATLEFSDLVELTWSAAPNADFYLVQLNSSTNFDGPVLDSYITSDTSLIVTENLVARRRYYWRVRPVNRYAVAGDYSEIFRFRNGEFTVSTMDETLNAALTVSPNPVRGGQELRIVGRDLGAGGTLNYQLLDPAGRVLQSREGLSVPATGFTDYVNTSDLPSGIYFLRLHLDDRLVTRRVVIW